MSRSRLVFATVAAVGLLGVTTAAAATYTETFSVNPASLVCSRVGQQETCLGTQNFSTATGATPFLLTAGQSVSVNVNYTTPLKVPGSPAESIAIVGLYDSTVVTTHEPASYTTDTGFSTLVGYISPTSEPLTDGLNVGGVDKMYTDVVGFLGPSLGAPTAGFSFDSMDSTFGMSNPTSQTLDPNEIVGAVFGYQYIGPAIPEPGTWALFIMGFGGLGATLRASRRARVST